MIVDLKPNPGETCELRVNGKTVTTSLGSTTTAVDPQLIHAATANSALRRIVLSLFSDGFPKTILIADTVETSPGAKAAAFRRGLLDGLEAVLVPHPMPGVPPIHKEDSPSYLRGYSYGGGIRWAAEQSSLLDDVPV